MSNPRGAVAVVLGTRPEIIKLAPVLRALAERGVPHALVHTGQHYSAELDAVFFADLALPSPDVALAIGSGSHGEQTGRMLVELERALRELAPRMVIVQGDTNSVLAGTLAAAKLGIPVAHVEAGLRSDDRAMPEELNRIVADHLSSWWFAPTELARSRLAGEGIRGARVVVTGNTVVDATRQHLVLARSGGFAAGLGLRTREYVVVTIHRAENTDDGQRLGGVVAGLLGLAAAGRTIVVPLHPRTRQRLVAAGRMAALEAHHSVRCLAPVGYLAFLDLLCGADVVLTDSGGVQEECTVLGIPCVTVRDNTERPETILVGANRLVACTREAIVRAVVAAAAGTREWSNPFGDGHAGARIAEIVATALVEPGVT